MHISNIFQRACTCWQVTSGMPALSYTHLLAALESPPLQVPASPQLMRAWTEGMISLSLPLDWILIRSAREEKAAWAQQLPQYTGMCWLRSVVMRPCSGL